MDREIKIKCTKLLDPEKEIKVKPELQEKFVIQLIESKVDDTENISLKIRETLANIMIKILVKSENSARIGRNTTESIDVVVKNLLNTPILLYIILNNNSSYIFTSEKISKFFNYVKHHAPKRFKIIPENSVEKFSNDVLSFFANPPYKFLIDKTHGGKQTLHKRRKLNKKITRRKVKPILGGAEPEGGIGVFSSYEKDFKEEENDSAKKQKIEEDAARAIESSGASYEQEKKMQEKFNEFNKKILENLTIKMNELESQEEILTKILAAAYINNISNYELILNTISKAIGNFLKDNIFIKESSEIILLHLLNKSGIYFHNSLVKTYIELKEKASAVDKEFVFDPLKKEFNAIFMRNFKDIIKKVVLNLNS